MKLRSASIAWFAAWCLGTQAMLVHAQPTLIATEQVAAAHGVVSAEAQRAQLAAHLDRAEVAAALAERGVTADQARARVAALTDAEVAQVMQTIDSAPAGGDLLGVLVFIFVLLLVTDILGFTKVFPFTRSIR
jgi:hypothetical protein